MTLPRRKSARGAIARTVRFPPDLRRKIAADAERCGRSFEAHVLAILRRHYGEFVDIAPSPSLVLALAEASVAGLTDDECAQVAGRLGNES